MYHKKWNCTTSRVTQVVNDNVAKNVLSLTTRIASMVAK